MKIAKDPSEYNKLTPDEERIIVRKGTEYPGTGKLLNPAQDPYVLAVGAEDSAGTPSIGDDTIPSFSTRGDGVRNPDVVAPGKSLQGLQ